MIRAEPSLNKDGQEVWYGQYCTGRFWHTVATMTTAGLSIFTPKKRHSKRRAANGGST